MFKGKKNRFGDRRAAGAHFIKKVHRKNLKPHISVTGTGVRTLFAESYGEWRKSGKRKETQEKDRARKILVVEGGLMDQAQVPENYRMKGLRNSSVKKKAGRKQTPRVLRSVTR